MAQARLLDFRARDPPSADLAARRSESSSLLLPSRRVRGRAHSVDSPLLKVEQDHTTANLAGWVAFALAVGGRLLYADLVPTEVRAGEHEQSIALGDSRLTVALTIGQRNLLRDAVLVNVALQVHVCFPLGRSPLDAVRGVAYGSTTSGAMLREDVDRPEVVRSATLGDVQLDQRGVTKVSNLERLRDLSHGVAEVVFPERILVVAIQKSQTLVPDRLKLAPDERDVLHREVAAGRPALVVAKPLPVVAVHVPARIGRHDEVTHVAQAEPARVPILRDHLNGAPEVVDVAGRRAEMDVTDGIQAQRLGRLDGGRCMCKLHSFSQENFDGSNLEVQSQRQRALRVGTLASLPSR